MTQKSYQELFCQILQFYSKFDFELCKVKVGAQTLTEEGLKIYLCDEAVSDEREYMHMPAG